MSEDPVNLRELRAQRLAFVKEHLRCPHCDKDLERWDVPPNPTSNMAADHLYVCANAHCPYFINSWELLAQQGARGGSYWFVYDPSRDWCGPMPAHIPRPRPNQ